MLLRYVTKDGLVASEAAETQRQPKDEVRLSLLDVVASPFVLEDGFLPQEVREVLANNVLRKLALFRDRLHRSHVARRALMAFGQHLVLDTTRRAAGGQAVVEILGPPSVQEVRRVLTAARRAWSGEAPGESPPPRAEEQ